MTGIDIMYYSLLALALIWAVSIAYSLFSIVRLARKLKRNSWKP